MPFIKRETGGKEIQLWLTPEQRRGSMAQMTCTIKHRSMQRLDPTIRTKRIFEFCTNIVPAAFTSLQISTRAGVPFNIRKFITNAAEEIGIGDFVVDIFDDPEFQKRLSIMMQLNPGKAEILNPKAIGQNKGFPMSHSILTGEQESNQFAQQTAGEGQQRRNNLDGY
jgi:hypothetical protein